MTCLSPAARLQRLDRPSMDTSALTCAAAERTFSLDVNHATRCAVEARALLLELLVRTVAHVNAIRLA